MVPLLTRYFISLFFVLYYLLCPQVSWGQLPHIKLGVSNAITGPVSQLGKKLNLGANAYFTQLNHSGGIHGQLVKMDVRDDGYEPFQTYKNINHFLRQGDILLFSILLVHQRLRS